MLSEQRIFFINNFKIILVVLSHFVLEKYFFGSSFVLTKYFRNGWRSQGIKKIYIHYNILYTYIVSKPWNIPIIAFSKCSYFDTINNKITDKLVDLFWTSAWFSKFFLFFDIFWGKYFTFHCTNYLKIISHTFLLD